MISFGTSSFDFVVNNNNILRECKMLFYLTNNIGVSNSRKAKRIFEHSKCLGASHLVIQREVTQQ